MDWNGEFVLIKVIMNQKKKLCLRKLTLEQTIQKTPFQGLKTTKVILFF
jgi:hypothetical protein